MMRIRALFLCLFLSACQLQEELPDPVLKHSCEETVKSYALLRDEGPLEDYLGLFTDDAVFNIGGTITRGRDALAARFKAANKDQVWRHMMGDIHINSDLTGISRVIAYVGPREDGPVTPFREIHADYHDKYVMVGKVCLIQSREVDIIFDRKL